MTTSAALIELPVCDAPPEGEKLSQSFQMVTTNTGRQIDLFHPNPAQVALEDIAHALSRLPLYNGHTKGDYIYSVAIRSCWVARYLYRLTGDSEMALHGLMHWSAQAYTGTSVMPTGRLFSDTNLLIKKAIYMGLDLPVLKLEHCRLLDQAFTQVQMIELESLLPPGCAEGDKISAQIDDVAKQLHWLEPIEPWMVCGAFQQYFETLKRGELV
ncbi:MAG: hypothetical protein K6L74_16855 [Neptuniibacter sp.]